MMHHKPAIPAFPSVVRGLDRRDRDERGFARRCPGFTLVEMLVVMGILSMLVALLMPAMSRVRAETRSTQCLWNLKQIVAAVQTYRAGADNLLPFSAPLPAITPLGPVGGLPDALDKIMRKESQVWLCPSYFDAASPTDGLSYVYTAGAFMMLEPLNPANSPYEHAKTAARLVTQRFDNGYLKTFPVVADSEDRHDERADGEPRNGVFCDGHARRLHKKDGIINDDGTKG